MPIPRGSRYADPVSRYEVMLPNGERVTRAQAENLYAQSPEGGGYTNNYQRRKAMESTGFRQYKGRPGYKRAVNEGMSNGKSKQEVDSYLAKYYQNPRNRLDNTPNGPKAQMLQAMGRRSPGSEYRVGESPSVM